MCVDEPIKREKFGNPQFTATELLELLTKTPK